MRTVCYLLEGLLAHVKAYKSKDGKKATLDTNEKELFESNFVFACIWACGGR